MSQITALQGLLSTLVQRGTRLIDRRSENTREDSLEGLCTALLSRRGEASGLAIAARIVAEVEALDDDAFVAFAEMLSVKFDPDAEAVRAAAEDYATDPTPEALETLLIEAEPPRQELLRRLNSVPGGTEALVRLRARLIGLLQQHPTLSRINADLQHLFASWFNRGFLVISPIDWTTSAAILEKIIRYEAVHAIDSWDELRRRLEPEDRRCFGFFHPAMPNEPLIFVEVALTNDIPSSIGAVLTEEREIVHASDATTAVFYSISNCQKGLAGISFGNFLIKQVAQDLSRALPNLTSFVTLSPVPGLVQWIAETAADTQNEAAGRVIATLRDTTWVDDHERAGTMETDLLGLAATYLVTAKRKDGLPRDPVARFHLGNGAILRQINWMADRSPKGLAQSAGLMVNYLYDLATVEDNHEAFAEHGEVVAAKPVLTLLPASTRNTLSKVST